MKIACITDTHFGARNDSQIFFDYFMKFYDEVFFPYLEKNGITTVIHLGDIVDRRKFINFVVLHGFRNQFIKQFVDRGIDLHVLVGNHDTPYRNTNDINAMQELISEETIKLYSEPELMNFDGTDILMMPWINNGNFSKCMEVIDKTPAQIMFAHLEIMGFDTMAAGLKCDTGFDRKVFNKFDIVASGHFHHRSSQDNIQYLGAPYEMTWADYGDPRGFNIFDTDKREFTFIQNPYKMHYKLFYDDSNKTAGDIMQADFSFVEDRYIKVVVVSKKNSLWFDSYLDRLYKFNPQKVTIIDDGRLRENFDGDLIVNEAEDTLTIINNRIDLIRDDAIDPNSVKQTIQRLYNEALMMEY